MEWLSLPVILLLVLFLVFYGGWYTVKEQQAVIIQRLGKFEKVAFAGLHLKIPFLDAIAGRVTLKVQQLDVGVETKTQDNVFVHLKVSVQYNILRDSVFDAFYKLESPHTQITSYVFDVIRAEVPKMKLDQVFERKDDLAIAVKKEIDEAMHSYGYGIIKALVTDINPDEQVKHAMNRINASEREKVAAQYESEAERIRIVAKAQAEAESKKLQGEGIANQRREIAKGLEESVAHLNKVGISSQEASALIIIVQHYDTLHAIGASSKSNMLILPSSPSTASDLMTSLVSSFSAAQHLTNSTNTNPDNHGDHS
ncbi:MAG: SPFH domain-containing protein [Cytophagales bacterium]